MKKFWLNLLRLFVTAAALACLLWQVDLRATLAALRRAELLYLGAALVLYTLGLVIRAHRWNILVRVLGVRVPFVRLLRLYVVGQFFNAILPSAFGGDVVRALELTRDADSSAAVGTVLLDRMIGLLVLFAASLLALPFYAAQVGTWLTVLLFVVMAGGLAVGGLILEGRLLRRLTQSLPGVFSLAGQGRVARVYTAVTSCGWGAVGRAAGVS
ncbi:MAG: flippase-like domain-containing protein, partial [Anaerolineales bacterium]